MSTYTQYTGTFTKSDGTTRTMTFIKPSDLPMSHFSSNQRKQRRSRDGKTEVVYDTQLRAFRQFNYSTQIGQLSESKVTYSFDS